MSTSKTQHAWLALATLIVALISLWLGVPNDQQNDDSSPVLVEGQVDRVIDGDTVDVMHNGEVIRVRLIGIDTPETVDPRKEVECFGEEASEHMKELVEGEQLVLEYDDSQGRVDKYGRQLAYLRLENGTNVGEKMISDGYAYEYTYAEPYLYQKDFQNAEQEARNHELGLWSRETCAGER